MMSRVLLVLALAMCVSADSALLSSVTSVASDLKAVTRFFTINRITKTKYTTETSTTLTYPTCTTATVASCAPNAMGRSFNFEVINPSRPEEIELTTAPGYARVDLPADFEEEETFEFGELLFSSQETANCFVPKQRDLADHLVSFLTTTTSTETVTTTGIDIATTVTVSYGGCIPSDALSTAVCV